MMLEKVLLTISLFVLLIVCAELLSSMPPEPNPEDLYCEMTQLFKDTGGELGWGEYNKNVKCNGAISTK